VSAIRAQTGPVVCTIATIVAVLAGTGVAVGAATRECLAMFAIAGLLAMAGQHRARLVAAVLCCIGIALVSAARAEDGVAHHALVPLVHDPRPIVVHGVLVGDPDPGRFSTTALLRVDCFRVAAAPDTADAWQRLHRTVLLNASAQGESEVGALAAGDVVDIEGDPRELTGFDARYVWQHAVARLDVARVVAAAPTRSPYLGLANALRSVIERGLAPLRPADHALLDGFILGDTRAIDDGTTADFRDAGLSHLLAVSGANVAFVLALVRPMQRRLPIVGRFLFGAAVVVVFAAMTRFEPSVLRASAMALIVMTARVSGRSIHALRSLCYAVIVLLIADPFLVHSVGFQLSASACAGIALLARPIEQRVPGPQWMRTVLAVTIAAQIGVAPVLVAVFGSVAWIAPAANLLAVPAAEPITVLAIPIAVVGAVAPLVAKVAFVPVVAMLWWTREVAHVSARSPVLVALAASVLVLGAAAFTRRRGRNPAVSSPLMSAGASTGDG
jgi:competence protein ComEC